jgi:hypothetical protein
MLTIIKEIQQNFTAYVNCCCKEILQFAPCIVASYPLPGQFVASHIPNINLNYFLNISYKDQIKHVTLKGNDLSNLVHQYHFNTYHSGTKKKMEKIITSKPGLPYWTYL